MSADLIERVYGTYTKASRERLQAMVDACHHIDANNIEGDVVECGVWKGGHIILARLISPSRCCWLYDTFNGMPRPDKHKDVKVQDKGRPALDTWKSKTENGNKWAAASVEEVIANLRTEGVCDPHKTILVPGQVETTLKQEDHLPKKIALLRLDTDWYSSTKIELEVLYPRLASGGILIIDDYGHWRGCRDACQEYFRKRGINYAEMLKPIDYTAVQMVKP